MGDAQGRSIAVPDFASLVPDFVNRFWQESPCPGTDLPWHL